MRLKVVFGEQDFFFNSLFLECEGTLRNPILLRGARNLCGLSARARVGGAPWPPYVCFFFMFLFLDVEMIFVESYIFCPVFDGLKRT